MPVKSLQAARPVDRLLRSTTVVVALVPAVAYGVALAYELGFAQYFGIPRYVITVTLTDALYALSWICLVVTGVILHANVAYLLVPWARIPSEYRRKLESLAPFLLLVVGSAVLWARGLPDWYVGVLPAALLSLVAFGLPLIRYREVPGYSAKLRADLADRGNEGTLFVHVAATLGRSLSTSLVWFVVFLFFAHMLGRTDACTQKSFAVTSDVPPVALVRAYGDTYVMCDYTSIGEESEPRLLVRKLSESHELRLVNKDIGPIRWPALTKR